ncbi:MAG TPA: Flp pilus assembly protein CpaB [Candidatus Tyrphobacter sp.]
MNKRNTLLIVAAILAAGAGLLTFNYLSAANRHVATSPPRPVLVAVADIPAHSPLNTTMVNVVMRPSSDVDPNALSSPSDLSGDIALGPIPAGATITSSNTSRDIGPTQGLHLMRGMRAISIPVDEVRDVSGLVVPGDKVDVIAVPPRIGSGTPTASIILRDITVFAVGGAVAPEVAGTPPPPGTPPTPNVPRSVTLEVTPAQADLLAMADLNATLRLALRPKGDRSGTTQELVFATQSTFAAPPPAAAAPAAPRRGRPAWSSPVEIIDGDQIGGPDSSGSTR